ncbi:MAG: hypothetical protein ACOYOE_03045 [Chlorobium sp.]
MANVSVYVSGQTEQSDVSEFFQKGLMSAGENPIAFFEGVFYESHQERVGNIAFQDYLIYTDKAVYLWARGLNKDYLDRFNLGSVSVNSRNKDHDFATLNLKIRREEKEPVYVIFDMVELREADLMIRLHTLMESIIEDRLGLNYRKNLPDDVAALILQGARGVCVPQAISFRFEAPAPVQQESHIGYGQDLLEQYKASLGYAPDERSPQHAGEHKKEGFSPADAMKGIENMLPTDPATLKRIAGSIKELIGDAPFKIRDQVKNDLQHVPGMLTALNELLNSIADNPQAERFVINIVKTAVRNDGMIGSVGKLLRLSSNFGETSKRRTQRSSPKADNAESNEDLPRARHRNGGDDSDTTPKRKSIHITSDDDTTLNDNCFNSDDGGSKNDAGSVASSGKKRIVDDLEGASTRKRITIKSFDENVPSIVKNMMSMDDFSSKSETSGELGVGESVARKKIMIRSDSEADNVQSAEKNISAVPSDDNRSKNKTSEASRLTGNEYDIEGAAQR